MQFRAASISLGLALATGAAAAQSAADFATRCQQWIDKKGYSTDYIEHKTGKRQPGLAPSWKGNVAPRDVQSGDVVFTSLASGGQRVSYVEEVEPDPAGGAAAVVVSEWNYGKRYIEKDCNVTDQFGQAGAKFRLPVNTLLRVWRPSLPLN